MKRKNKFPDSFAFIKDDKRPVSEEVKMADCIYFGSEKTIPFNECEEIAKLLAQYGYKIGWEIGFSTQGVQNRISIIIKKIASML